MDIPRKQKSNLTRRLRTAVYVILGLGAITLITLGVSRLKPAAPSMDKSTVWVDTVKRGPMLRQVRGSGTLVPEEIRWIPATTEGRVERILALPGTVVKADTVLLELSNPELVVAAQDAASELKAAQAE